MALKLSDVVVRLLCQLPGRLRRRKRKRGCGLQSHDLAVQSLLTSIIKAMGERLLPLVPLAAED